MGVLEDLQAERYRLGDLQALPYDRNNPVYGESYLVDLYYALGAGRRTPFRRENLQMLFCGMADLSLPAIVSYLAQQKLWILAKWEGERMRTAGLCWLSAIIGKAGAERAGFGAYAYLRWVWGHDDQEWLGWLGLSALIYESNLCQLHGQRYQSNHLTARFMAKFGFHDLVTVPKMIAKGDTLEACVLSTISREEFEANLSRKILEASL